MPENRLDSRLQQIPSDWCEAAIEIIDTADTILLQIEDWIAIGRIPSYDPVLHVELTRLVIERHKTLTTFIKQASDQPF